jgi:serpin B
MRAPHPVLVAGTLVTSLVVSLVVGACASEPAPAAAARPRPAVASARPPALVPVPVVATPVSASGSPVPVPAATSATPAPAADAPSLSEAEQRAEVRAANVFTAKLYARLKRTPGNVMISGTSVRHALALAALGARGDTAREMATALETPADTAKQIAVAKADAAAWQEARGDGAELVVADRLWTDKALKPKDDFTNAAQSAFGAGVEPVDFANAPDVARRTINTWISEKTSGKIPDLLAEGMIDKRTRLVVSDAIYFKARWSSPFSTGATKDEPFKMAAGRTATVPTMHDTAQHTFAHAGTTKLLSMRYTGSQLSMLVALPDDPAALAKLEESVSADTFDGWLKALTLQRVAITMPKFAFKWGAALEAPLQELGIRIAFSGKADFTGIAEPASGEKLQISRAVQKTWVSVDENGTEAAAASGVGMSVTSAVMGPIAEFKADHPFLFFVYDTKHGRILFAGRMSDPKS